MFNRLTFGFALLFVAFLGSAALAQPKPTTPPKAEEPKKTEATLVATWNVVFSAPDKEYPGTLKIEKDGETFKGTVTTELGEAPLGGLKVDGDSFTAGITINAQGQALDGTLSGKVTDGKLAGNLNRAGVGDIPFSGTKK
jgi:hypothetical protein